MALRENPIYEWRRYSADFDEGDLVPGTCAVEAA
jgi:hypothetical protein